MMKVDGFEKNVSRSGLKLSSRTKKLNLVTFPFNTIPSIHQLFSCLHLSFDGWLNGLAVIELTLCQEKH